MSRLLFFSISFLLLSCGSTTTPTPTVSDSTTDTATNTTDVTATEKSKNDRTTLKGFWASLQSAILKHDIAAIKTHYTTDARPYKFQADYYQEKIATLKATDWQKSEEVYGDTQVYELRLVFPEEGLDKRDYPVTTIYIQKNKDGAFEIFSVIEAG